MGGLLTRTNEQRVAVPFRIFIARVERLERLSPSFLRVTLTGADLGDFADTGWDQRIKLIFPQPDSGLAHVPTGDDWYAVWRTLPDHQRNPIRTYTARAVRQAAREVDVDVVLHGDGSDDGPGSRWARAARPGDEVAIMGPNAAFPGDPGGLEFKFPAHADAVLLAGDETAVPAVTAILERLPADTRGEALLEVPETADVLSAQAPPGVKVSWLARGGAEHGSLLVPAVEAAASRLLPAEPAARPGATLEDVDVDHELLWEVPVGADGAPLATASELYAWLAGEAAMIKTLRRHLVTDRGLDRKSVAFMGYWRRGRAEAND